MAGWIHRVPTANILEKIVTWLYFIFGIACGTKPSTTMIRISGNILVSLSVRKNEKIFTTAWWRHQMETFSALLALCAGNSPVTGEFPTQRPVTRSFDVFFDLRLNKPLSKHSWGWWFETPSRSLWHHCNGTFLSFCARLPYANCLATLRQSNAEIPLVKINLNDDSCCRDSCGQMYSRAMLSIVI